MLGHRSGILWSRQQRNRCTLGRADAEGRVASENHSGRARACRYSALRNPGQPFASHLHEAKVNSRK